MTTDGRKPKYGHVLGGHLLLDVVVSFPASALIAWIGLRFAMRVAFDGGELAALLFVAWVLLSLIDARIDYAVWRRTGRTQPRMPWPLIALKVLIPFVLPWLAALLHEDATMMAAACMAMGAVRLAELIGLERPWKGEDESVIERRTGELRKLNRETLEEIREERRTRAGRPDDAGTYDPYNLRGKR
ncbi:hypothetical protein [Bifidobacterium felsineum]|uniref:Uncharacterized protein n=1 Tax=Bifidobacterium felsineum TaxID=2045440 RepID=A0A2M9HLV9_9BIFI|nr:hypothetical protein [Bifidobacterium felsineum]PJM77796.1 hypothetical protein CSQ86_01690 [Bifidobacterium felsineum]